MAAITTHLYIDDEGDLNIEWTHKDFRYGIYVSKDRSEAGWYFISDEVEETGHLPEEFARLVKPDEEPEEWNTYTRAEAKHRSPRTDDNSAIKAFVKRVCERAEATMAAGHKLEGAHYAAMMLELERIQTDDNSAKAPDGRRNES